MREPVVESKRSVEAGKALRLFRRTVILLAVMALCLTGLSKHQYSPHDKAAYADAATVEFVHPGLVIKINSAQIASDGTITTVYTLTDPNGLPLDASGVTTPGYPSHEPRYPSRRGPGIVEE